jgi:hypothetical protein
MGIMDLIDRENLVCTFCGEKPVVGVTFAVDAEIENGETISRELVQKSVIATCKEHLPILQEKFEKEMKDADIVGELPEGFDD